MVRGRRKPPCPALKPCRPALNSPHLLPLSPDKRARSISSPSPSPLLSLATPLSFTAPSSLATLLSLIMPPGPGVTIEEYNRKQKARMQAQQPNMPKTGKPKTTTQQAASGNSATTKKRGNDNDSEW